MSKKFNTRKTEELGTRIYELDAEIKELENNIKENPVRDLLPLITRSGHYRGEVQ